MSTATRRTDVPCHRWVIYKTLFTWVAIWKEVLYVKVGLGQKIVGHTIP
jgi:hypothetical protein